MMGFIFNNGIDDYSCDNLLIIRNVDDLSTYSSMGSILSMDCDDDDDDDELIFNNGMDDYSCDNLLIIRNVDDLSSISSAGAIF
jgi:hypothetical protein